MIFGNLFWIIDTEYFVIPNHIVKRHIEVLAAFDIHIVEHHRPLFIYCERIHDDALGFRG